jgi:hypothetical protein
MEPAQSPWATLALQFRHPVKHGMDENDVRIGAIDPGRENQIEFTASRDSVPSALQEIEAIPRDKFQ